MVAICIVCIIVIALISLFVKPTKVEADPPKIVVSQNIKVYAFEQVLNRWGDEQWAYFNDLIKRESQWNSESQNPKSTAYGLGQFLNSTWKIVGCTKTSDQYKQIDCTIEYVSKIYGTPQKAIVFHKKNNYY